MRRLPYPIKSAQAIFVRLCAYFNDDEDAAEAVLARQVEDWPATGCSLAAAGVDLVTINHALEEGLFDLEELAQRCPGFRVLRARACCCYPGCGICFEGAGERESGCLPGFEIRLRSITRPVFGAGASESAETASEVTQTLTAGVEDVMERLRKAFRNEPEKVWATRKDLADAVRTNPTMLDKAMTALPDNERPILRLTRK